MTAVTDTRPPGLIELFGKELQTGMLLTALGRDRLGGTLLFHGADGSGKSSLAFWLAAALNCQTGDGQSEPCGECGSCRKVASLAHSDVHWVFPLPGAWYSGGAPDEGKLEDIYQRRRANPARSAEFSEKAEHHLAAVTRIRNEAGRSPYEGRRKVFVVTHADRLRQEAANAFLKLLEEPRKDVTVVLCSARPSSLLPTILSRCQRLQLTRPPAATVAAILAERYGIDSPAASRLARLSGADLSAALGLAEQGELESQREWVEKTFAAVLSQSQSQLLELLDERKGPFYNRGDFERYAALLAESLRDALLASVAGRKLDSQPVEDFAGRVADSRSLVKLVEKMVNLGDSLNRNVNLRLLGWSLLNDMKEVIGGRA